MNAIQKATFAASALTITLVGALLVTAPLAFGRSDAVFGQSACPTPSVQVTQPAASACSGALVTGLIA